MFCLRTLASTYSYASKIAVVPFSIHFVPWSRMDVVLKCVLSGNMYLNLKVCAESILSVVTPGYLVRRVHAVVIDKQFCSRDLTQLVVHARQSMHDLHLIKGVTAGQDASPHCQQQPAMPQLAT